MILTARHYTKPPLGSVLDFGHPLAKDIKAAFVLNESGGGIAVDLVRNIQLVASGSARFGGDGLICNAAYGGVDMLADSYQKMSGNITCLCALTQIGTPPNFASFCGTDYGTGGSPYVGYNFDHDNTGKVGASVNNGSTFQATANRVAISNFVRKSLAFTFVPGSSLKFYLDGTIQDSINPGGTNPIYTGSTRFHCGVRSTDNQNLQKIIHYWYVFNRALSAAEVREFHVNPYQMFLRKSRRFISASPASTSLTKTVSALGMTASTVSPEKLVTKGISALNITMTIQAPGKLVVKLPTAQTLTTSVLAPAKSAAYIATQLSMAVSVLAPAKKVTISPAAVQMVLSILQPSLSGSGSLTISVGALNCIASVLSPGKAVTKGLTALALTVEAKGITAKTTIQPSSLQGIGSILAPGCKVTISTASIAMTASTGIHIPVNRLTPAVRTVVAAVLGPSVRIDKVLIVNALTMAVQVHAPTFDAGGNFVHLTGPIIKDWIKQEIKYRNQIQIDIRYKG